ncbi:hypothetical protein BVRB_5g111060 [Beta vulgaris subsp. vulgaris]|nr:hypothetical protein BVRB_5g111060 [Beta vulgaris subsp. vulgaris]
MSLSSPLHSQSAPSNACPGTYNDLDHHQVAALASCFIPGDKSNEQIHLRAELAKPLQQLQDSARRIAQVRVMKDIYGNQIGDLYHSLPYHMIEFVLEDFEW